MKITLSVLLLLFTVSGFGQSFNVQSAANALKYKETAKAKAAIDLAAANEQTANDPKMWYYRGETYLAIYRDTTELGKSEPDAPEKAAISFMNVIKADNGHYSSAAFTVDDAYNQVWIAGVALAKRAEKAFDNNDLERASR